MNKDYCNFDGLFSALLKDSPRCLNKKTEKVFKETDAGKGIVKCKDLDHLFKLLKI